MQSFPRIALSQRLLSLAVALALAGCQGSTTGTPPPVATSAPASGATTPATTLRIVIPAHTALPSSTARTPQYISPATASITGTLTPSGGGSAITFAQNLAPSNPDCQGSASTSLTCTVHFDLGPGSYTASLSTYDGPLNGQTPTGNVLSENQSFPVTVVAGQSNTIPVTLYGVPKTIAVIANPGTEIGGSQSSGYTIAQCVGLETAGIDSFSVVALDSDKNIIVGPGAPVPTLTSPNASLTVAAPVAKSPNAFTIGGPTAPASFGASGSVVSLGAMVTTPAATASAGGITTPIVLSATANVRLGPCEVVTSTADTVEGTPPGSGAGATGDLRSTMLGAPANSVIVFSLGSGCTATAPCVVKDMGPLPPIDENLTIDGAGATSIDGDGAFRAFFVDTGTVTLRGLTLQNVVARGGNGGNGEDSGGGGGGLGAGAGLFVNQASASVSVVGVVFASPIAIGGRGGSGTSGGVSGGGGGLGGAGGNPFESAGGGGGVLGPGPTTFSINGGDGGLGGGGGAGADTFQYGASPGAGGAAYTSSLTAGSPGAGGRGGMGGFGGGAGGVGTVGNIGANGGFGGGGGSLGDVDHIVQGGSGGFGAGGGGGVFTTATGGAGGTYGGSGELASSTSTAGAGGGGGGGALGPAIFVNQGSVTIVDSSASGATATAGLGGDSLAPAPNAGNGTAIATPVFNVAGTVNGVTVTTPTPVTGAL